MEKKKNGFLRKLRDKYRLIIYNDVTFKEVFQLKLSRLNLFIITSFVAIFLVAVTIIIIAFTPLKELIPGYPEANLRRTIINNALTIDSLKKEITLRNKYLADIQKLVSGRTPHSTSKNELLTKKDKKQKVTFDNLRKDSLFRMQIEKHEKYNVAISNNNNPQKDISKLLFFPPLKGMITNTFNIHNKHYGTDIVSAGSNTVKAILDGIIIMNTWTIETGYVIQIQHKHNLISVYKHNADLLKNTGEHVEAGEIIAIVGNSGELSTGPHLHFELWHDGHPVDPEEYIDF